MFVVCCMYACVCSVLYACLQNRQTRVILSCVCIRYTVYTPPCTPPKHTYTPTIRHTPAPHPTPHTQTRKTLINAAFSPPSIEPTCNLNHHDYLLKEMQWLAVDVAQVCVCGCECGCVGVQGWVGVWVWVRTGVGWCTYGYVW